MSLAREKPFQHLSNDQVIQNAEHMYYGGELQVSVYHSNYFTINHFSEFNFTRGFNLCIYYKLAKLCAIKFRTYCTYSFFFIY